jgi:hypothetical protein
MDCDSTPAQRVNISSSELSETNQPRPLQVLPARCVQLQQERLWCYDNLRTALIVLLIIRHSGIAYGGPRHPGISIPQVAAFNPFNPSFSREMFFCCPVTFLRGADNGRRGKFIWSKLVRWKFSYTLLVEQELFILFEWIMVHKWVVNICRVLERIEGY